MHIRERRLTMQTFHHCSSKQSIPVLKNISEENILLFDIETTGLSPDASTIFMIGCGYYEDSRLHTIHWLADGYETYSEQEIFLAFSDWFIHHFQSSENVHIITYNGHKFDLPFLKSRYEQCQIPLPYSSTIIEHSIDYYRHILPLKHLWPVHDLKLHTLSAWLGYQGSHTPSGRQLIKTYHTYIKTKDPVLLNLLFLHNIDDLESLSKILSLETFFQFFNGNYTIDSISYSEEHIIFKMHSNSMHPFPSKLEYQMEGFALKAADFEAVLLTPVHPNGLRYYYSDHKNYVYLPLEDHVLHKSMAKYIDKSHWIKANKKNCYTWFIPDTFFFESEEKQRDYIQMVFRLFRLI